MRAVPEQVHHESMRRQAAELSELVGTFKVRAASQAPEPATRTLTFAGAHE
jgi:hypothetical protein